MDKSKVPGFYGPPCKLYSSVCWCCLYVILYRPITHCRCVWCACVIRNIFQLRVVAKHIFCSWLYFTVFFFARHFS